MKKIIALCLFFPMLALADNAQQVTQYFNSIKDQPGLLRLFLTQMPKGGELHYHIDGAPYPENLINHAQGGHFCFDPATESVSQNTQCSAEYQLDNIGQNPSIYNKIVDTWSVTQHFPTLSMMGDHFFHSFLDSASILAKYPGKVVAEEMNRAAMQHEDYLEIIFIPNVPDNLALGSQIAYTEDYAKLEAEFKAQGIQAVVDKMKMTTEATEQGAQQALKCGTKEAMPGCHVKVRYIYAVLRTFSPSQVFEQTMAGFMLAQQDLKVVGVNFVMPENDYDNVHTYDMQMNIVRYFRQRYPQVHVSLHAGELSLQTTAPEYMQDHIDKAINIAGAERIGHGTDILYEKNAVTVLHEMEKRHIPVEICLSSNETILGVKNKAHPLPVYLHYHVPVVLDTDDEGILRTTLTSEYLKAVTRYHLSYQQIKNIARNAIAYSFLPGQNLWQNLDRYTPVDVCKHDVLGSKNPSQSCAAFLKQSEKAQMQWQLESEFNQFESTIIKEMKK